jgi:predicted 2-oxoglutarate/Fe(II)-dependent dioxygenase YbiX
MLDGALFSVEMLTQEPQTQLAPGDPFSEGTMRVTMAGVDIWNDVANLTSSALCLLRTTRGDFVGPMSGVSDTNPLIHHCGALPEMGCPIGASWHVAHVGSDVHIDTIVRASEVGEDEPVLGLPEPFVIDRALYTDCIRTFAAAVRDGLHGERDRYAGTADPMLAPLFDAFWAEYAMLLSSRELIATELTPDVIEELLAESSIVEATPGLFVIDVCDADRCAALVARAERAAWNGATINDRSLDRAIRDADVLDAAAHPDVIAEVHELLALATRDFAAEVAPNAVLRELQLVRYRAGGYYLDHRDTPAIGATPRTLSLVWYLNDGFTGGETRFVSPDIIVTPVRGVAIAFSPVLMHRSEPVGAGVKYAVVAWYHH